MKEKLYAIPVNDAFKVDCECPVCEMYKTLEKISVEYVMGPSYMEDDVREVTDRLGFCEKHIHMVYNQNNRLGMALVMSTHFKKTISDIKKLDKKSSAPKSLFGRSKETGSPVTDYINRLNSSCFVCSRINQVFDRYISTIFHLWSNDRNFKELYSSSKGFCTKHYGDLLTMAPEKLRGSDLDDFLDITNKLYIENMERVMEDIDWFINKFDYRYEKESWKNSKDALPRSIIKTNSTDIENGQ